MVICLAIASVHDSWIILMGENAPFHFGCIRAYHITHVERTNESMPPTKTVVKDMNITAWNKTKKNHIHTHTSNWNTNERRTNENTHNIYIYTFFFFSFSPKKKKTPTKQKPDFLFFYLSHVSFIKKKQPNKIKNNQTNSQNPQNSHPQPHRGSWTSSESSDLGGTARTT